MDQDQDNASVAGSISTTEEHIFLILRTDVEKNVPWLAKATKENVRVFIQAFKKYRDEDNGIRQMTALVRTETRTVLCEHFLKISVQDFLSLENEECIQRLSDKFHLAANSQYRAKMKTTYMMPVQDDQADVEQIQKYVARFLGLLTRNPQFLDVRQKGATPKIMNDLLIEGFSPPVFRNRVKSLGTTDITSTIDMLDSLYDELEVYQTWTPKSKVMQKSKSDKSQATEEPKDSKPKLDFIPCTKQKCNSTRHSAEECYFLHPELRPDFRKNQGSKKSFKAQVANLAEDMTKSEASVASLADQLAQLKAELAMKADKVFIDIQNTSKIKPKLFDSGNNYSVIADVSHKDPNTNIILTSSEETLGTAGGTHLPVRGDGHMETLPSVYVPDANASMISVQQFCEQRDAVALVLKDGAVGIKLNN